MQKWWNWVLAIGLVCLLLIAIPISYTGNKKATLQLMFDDYIAKFNKTYKSDPAEYQTRFQHFMANLEEIEKLNAAAQGPEEHRARYGLTRLSDMSKLEYQDIHLSDEKQAKPPQDYGRSWGNGDHHHHHHGHTEDEVKVVSRAKRAALPLKIDWRTQGVVGPVRSQGLCGACWAFSAVGMIEAMNAIATGKYVQLSVQEAIDCAGLGNSGCSGGDICLLLDWLLLSGSSLQREAQYPLRLADGTCQLKNNATGVQVASFTCDDFVGAEDKILQALATHGPVAVAVNALTWQNYLGGVIQFHCRHKELFSGGLGRFTGGEVALHVREGTVPVFCRARPLPYALRGRVDAELDGMLREGVIEPVAASDWATPLVPVSKADGGLRICADYKITLNSALLVDRYPLPRFEDLLVTLNNSVIFSKCDLSQAYNQLVLDESSKQYTVINTHKGLFRYNRLVYGLSSSSGIFQRTMSNLLKGIPFVGIFIDDVIIGGRNITEHLQSLEMVMSRLCENGLKLKRNKCEFLVDEIKYLGYIISKDGVKTDPDKIKAMSEMAQPQNVTQLRSFLGLVNFYGRFVKNMSSILSPLYELLKKNVSWVWSDTCARAFNEVKRILSSSEVLAHYDESKPLILSCDASAQGVGGVLTQRGPRGERPVAYVSRTLNDAEKNYAQIHREALAIIFCLKKFHQYLYGRKFTLRTDHKPLVTIFGPKAGVPAMAASRLQRWAVIVSAYTYDIEYVNTKDNVADSFSRLPIKSRDSGYHRIPEQTYLHFVQDTSLIDSAHIKKETAKDHILGRVVSYIRDGWPKDVDMKNLKPYFNRKNELYLELGCVMWGHRVVIPESCQAKVLSELHEPHMGIVKTKCIARSYVWWPGVDEAVEAACRACAACAAASDAPRAHQPCPWPWCPRPWTRLHLDFMGPIDNKLYLVLVDATSKWLEVFQVPSTGAAHTIDRLNEVFGRFGLPKTLVSDNGPPFTSSQFSQFTQSNGIKHMFSAPYHPASNGAAENAVRTLKKVIKKAKSESVDIATALNKFLLHYRNTEHCTTGDSPAQLLMGHSLRTKLDVLKPDRENKIVHAQMKQSENKGGEKRDMRPGDPVWYRLYQKGDKWTAGEVSERLGATDYNIRNPDGTLTHRHVDQLRQRSRVSLAGPLPSCAPEQADSPAQSRAHDAGDSAGTSDLAPDNHQMSSESAAPPEPTEQPPPPPVSLPQSPSNAPRPPRVTRNLNAKYK